MILTQYDSDLFGEPPDIPHRGTREYLTYLNDLELPNGWRFVSLAPQRQVVGAPVYVETIWCIDRDDKWVNLIVDLRTGQKWDGS